MSINRYSFLLFLVVAALLLLGPVGIIVGFSALVLVVLAIVAGIALGVVAK